MSGSGSISLGLTGDVANGNPNYALDVGGVLGRTFGVWGANLVPFCLVGLVVHSPVLLALVLIGLSGTSQPLLVILLDFLSSFLTLVLTGAVTYGVFQELRGADSSAGEILRLGLSRLGTVFLTGLLSGLATFLGFCALIVPGFVLLSMWWVAVPVAVIESPGASASLSRSNALTEGNRWRVLAVALVIGTGVLVVTILLTAALTALAGVRTATGSELSAWSQAFLKLVLIPTQALAAVAPAIVYHDLRVGREGADVDELLKVFE
jgi:hypothetical protein